VASYNLEADEYVILTSVSVYKNEGGMFTGLPTGELMLTNKAIVFSRKGLTGKVKDYERFPLSTVKVFEDRAQARLGVSSSNAPTLDVYFTNGQASFVFRSKSEVIKWVNEINMLLTGNNAISADTANSVLAIPGAEAIASAVAGTIDVFKNAFDRSRRESAEPVSVKCPSCSGVVHGRRGDSVPCPYCGSYIVLG
jgi:ribosomal protein S27E